MVKDVAGNTLEIGDRACGIVYGWGGLSGYGTVCGFTEKSVRISDATVSHQTYKATGPQLIRKTDVYKGVQPKAKASPRI